MPSRCAETEPARCRPISCRISVACRTPSEVFGGRIETRWRQHPIDPFRYRSRALPWQSSDRDVGFDDIGAKVNRVLTRKVRRLTDPIAPWYRSALVEEAWLACCCRTNTSESCPRLYLPGPLALRCCSARRCQARLPGIR